MGKPAQILTLLLRGALIDEVRWVGEGSEPECRKMVRYAYESAVRSGVLVVFVPPKTDI